MDFCTIGHERLEKACERVLSYATEPSIRIISTVLKNKQTKFQWKKNKQTLFTKNLVVSLVVHLTLKKEVHQDD